MRALRRVAVRVLDFLTPLMQPHQQRVVTEKQELDEKLEKLSAFLGTETFRGLDEAEQLRLIRQEERMGEYSDVLGERIAAFV